MRADWAALLGPGPWAMVSNLLLQRLGPAAAGPARGHPGDRPLPRDGVTRGRRATRRAARRSVLRGGERPRRVPRRRGCSPRARGRVLAPAAGGLPVLVTPPGANPRSTSTGRRCSASSMRDSRSGARRWRTPRGGSAWDADAASDAMRASGLDPRRGPSVSGFPSSRGSPGTCSRRGGGPERLARNASGIRREGLGQDQRLRVRSARTATTRSRASSSRSRSPTG